MKCLLILSWLISHGYTQPESIGIVSNLYIESKCNSQAQNPSQIGIAQWQGKRKKNLLSLAKETQIPISNLFLQLYFLDLEWKEIKQKSPSTYARRTSHVSSYDLAIIFCKKFERPKLSCKSRGKVANLRPWEKDK